MVAEDHDVTGYRASTQQASRTHPGNTLIARSPPTTIDQVRPTSLDATTNSPP